jgi:hypothetical protein
MWFFFFVKKVLKRIKLFRVKANDTTGDLQNTVTYDSTEDGLHFETRILTTHKLGSRLLGYYTVLTGKELQTFQKSIATPPTFRVKQSEMKTLRRLLYSLKVDTHYANVTWDHVTSDDVSRVGSLQVSAECSHCSHVTW